MSYSFANLQLNLEQALEHSRADFNSLRTGRASVGLVDTIRVEAYGSMMQLLELASISLSDQLIVIKPYDRSLLENIEKAISKSDIHIQPVVDKDVVKLVIPSLTEDRRLEMVKMLHQKIEAGKIMIRGVRTDAKKEIEALKGQDGVSEDDIHADIDTLEQHIKTGLEKLEKMGEQKEKELLTV